MARAGQVARIDHRTLEAQQSEFTPGRKVGVERGRQAEQTLPSHLQERIALGLPFPFPVMSPDKSEHSPTPPSFSPKEILHYLDSISDPEQAADLVSCAVLPGAVQRQTILATVDVESRLRRLIHFLLAEIQEKRKGEAL